MVASRVSGVACIRLAERAKDTAAEYLAWAEEEQRQDRRERYLGYAATRLFDARWYVERAERIAA